MKLSDTKSNFDIKSGHGNKATVNTGICSRGISACHMSPFENKILKYSLEMSTYHNLWRHQIRVIIPKKLQGTAKPAQKAESLWPFNLSFAKIRPEN